MTSPHAPGSALADSLWPLGNDEDPAGTGPELATGPTTARLILGARLRQHREATGLDGKDAAAAIGGSPAKISRIEHGTSPVACRDVTLLLDLYQVGDPQARGELLSLAELSQERGWWALAGNLPASTRNHLALEAEAFRVMVYEPQAIPAILQTPRYAQAVAAVQRQNPPAWRGGLTAKVLARRRGVLSLPNPPHVWVLIQAAALTRNPSTDPAVLRDQLLSLHARAGHGITFQILPDNTPAALAAPGPFSVLRFSQPEVPALVLLETLTGIECIDRRDVTDLYYRLFSELAVQALKPDDSLLALQDIIDRIPGSPAFRPAGQGRRQDRQEGRE
jgi:transcriptional regulator with XRE-family HTH domain